MKLENYIVENWVNDSPYMSRGLKSFAFSPLMLLVINRKKHLSYKNPHPQILQALALLENPAYAGVIPETTTIKQKPKVWPSNNKFKTGWHIYERSHHMPMSQAHTR